MSIQLCDIHMHVLPGIDDGSDCADMSASLLFQARSQGVRAVFATPHSYAFPRELARAKQEFLALQRLCSQRELEVALYFGCEVACSAWDIDETIQLLRSGYYPTMNGTKYVLAEFYPSVWRKDILLCAGKLLEAGFLPIIAHAERCENLDSDTVRQLKDMGCKIQVNVYSLYDEGKDHIRNFARELAREQLIDFLGSDAHKTYHRPPSLTMGMQWLIENCPKDYLQKITWENARDCLTGE